jgi:hypothetical protein
MSPSALVPNGVMAARPGCVNSDQATKPFRQLQRQRIKCICLKLKAITTLALAFLILAAALPQPSLAVPGTWSFTDSLGFVRSQQTDTLLPSGQVLLAGGYSYTTKIALCQLYNPVLQTFFPTGPMNDARVYHGATLLFSGKVLMTGGYISATDDLASAELYDPSGVFAYTKGSMPTGRSGHTASLLPDGKVLVAGGWVPNVGPTNTAVLYDPSSETFAPTQGNMAMGREQARAITLLNGKVLIMGSRTSTSHVAELYDPTSQTFSPTAVPMIAYRFRPTATLLPDGRVLVTGGDDEQGVTLKSAEIFNPTYDTYAPTNSMNIARRDHTATLLINGKVLITGGQNNTPGYIDSAEIYDPLAGTFSPTGSMGIGRILHTATRLANGQVLVAGGLSQSLADLRAELYDPVPPPQVNLPPLLAFYLFEGNARDASGNGRHGTVSGTPQLTSGYEGQAYSFNGTTDYITVNLNINPAIYPKLAMGGWAKTSSLWPLQQLLTNDNGDFDRSLGIDFRGAGIGWSAFCGPGGQVLGARPAFVDAWTFVAVMYDQAAQTVKLQVEDMVLTKTGATLGAGQNQLFIGASPLFSTFFAGVMDNVFIFGDVLSQQQTAFIRQGGASAILTAPRGPQQNSMAPITWLLLD